MSDFFTADFFVQIFASLVASVAFAVVFRTGPRHLPFAGIGGLVTYALYYLVAYFNPGVFLAAFLSTMFAALFSECCARWRHAPAAVFLFPSIIPTVPGGGLYYTMRYLLSGEKEMMLYYLSQTMKVALGIAGGIVSVSVFVGVLYDIKKKRLYQTSN